MLRPDEVSIKHGSSVIIPYRHNRKEKCKSFCRKTIAFMCTQVGVGGLIVVYALVGAFAFQSIEKNVTAQQYNYTYHVSLMRSHYAQRLWMTARKYNVFNESAWKAEVNSTIKTFQDDLTAVMVKHGYEKRTLDEIWSFPAALMFCLSVFSMIGYGKLVPRTDWGKATTIIYATFGIPLYILYFLSIGKELARVFRWIYRRIHNCSRDPMDDSVEKKKVIVPSTACIWVLFTYILLGSIMFTYLDDWEFMNSVYFSVTSLCKIGMGDFVPETSTNATLPAILKNEKNTKLIINFVYILFGMGVVAMCHELMREDIRDKIREVKEDMTLCLEDLRIRLAGCCGANGKNFEEQQKL